MDKYLDDLSVEELLAILPFDEQQRSQVISGLKQNTEKELQDLKSKCIQFIRTVESLNQEILEKS